MDGETVCAPMGWDAGCAGAICSTVAGPVAVFEDKHAARRAIRISTAYAKLCREQGKPINADFTDGAKAVKVLTCEWEPRDA